MPISTDAVATAAIAIPTPKLAPPPGLTREQADIWTAITNRLPAEQFAGDNAGLLELYTAHLVLAHRLTVEIEALRGRSLRAAKNRRAIAQLARLRATETKAAASLAVKLGLCLSARYDRGEQARNRRKDAIADNMPKPWECWRERRGADA